MCISSDFSKKKFECCFLRFDAKESDSTSDALELDQLSAEMDRVLQRQYTVWFYKKLFLLFYKKRIFH